MSTAIEFNYISKQYRLGLVSALLKLLSKVTAPTIACAIGVPNISLQSAVVR